MRFINRLCIFMLGFIMGIVGCVGGLAGGVYYAYTGLSVEDFTGTLSKEDVPVLDTDADRNITQMTMEEIVTRFVGLMNGEKDLTIANLEEIYGLDLSALQIPENVRNMPLDKLFKDGASRDEALSYITFGTVAELLDMFKINFLTEKYAHLFGKDGKLYNVQIMKVIKDDGYIEALKDVYFTDLLPAGMLEEMEDGPVKTLIEALSDLSLGELLAALIKKQGSVVEVIFGADSIKNLALSELIPESLSSLKTLLAGITLGDVIYVDENGAIQFSADKILEEITLRDILGLAEFFGKTVEEIVELIPEGNVRDHVNSLLDWSIKDIIETEDFTEFFGNLTIGDLADLVLKIIGDEDAIKNLPEPIPTVWNSVACIGLGQLVNAIKDGTLEELMNETVLTLTLEDMFGSYVTPNAGKIPQPALAVWTKVRYFSIYDYIHNIEDVKAQLMSLSLRELCGSYVFESVFITMEDGWKYEYAYSIYEPDFGGRKALLPDYICIVFDKIEDYTIEDYYNAYLCETGACGHEDKKDCFTLTDMLGESVYTITLGELLDCFFENREGESIIPEALRPVYEAVMKITVGDIVRTILGQETVEELLGTIYDLKIEDLIGGWFDFEKLPAVARNLYNKLAPITIGEIVKDWRCILNALYSLTIDDIVGEYIPEDNAFVNLIYGVVQNLTLGDIKEAIEKNDYLILLRGLANTSIKEALEVIIEALEIKHTYILDNVVNSFDGATIGDIILIIYCQTGNCDKAGWLGHGEECATFLAFAEKTFMKLTVADFWNSENVDEAYETLYNVVATVSIQNLFNTVMQYVDPDNYAEAETVWDVLLNNASDLTVGDIFGKIIDIEGKKVCHPIPFLVLALNYVKISSLIDVVKNGSDWLFVVEALEAQFALVLESDVNLGIKDEEYRAEIVKYINAEHPVSVQFLFGYALDKLLGNFEEDSKLGLIVKNLIAPVRDLTLRDVYVDYRHILDCYNKVTFADVFAEALGYTYDGEKWVSEDASESAAELFNLLADYTIYDLVYEGGSYKALRGIKVGSIFFLIVDSIDEDGSWYAGVSDGMKGFIERFGEFTLGKFFTGTLSKEELKEALGDLTFYDITTLSSKLRDYDLNAFGRMVLGIRVIDAIEGNYKAILTGIKLIDLIDAVCEIAKIDYSEACSIIKQMINNVGSLTIADVFGLNGELTVKDLFALLVKDITVGMFLELIPFGDSRVANVILDSEIYNKLASFRIEAFFGGKEAIQKELEETVILITFGDIHRLVRDIIFESYEENEYMAEVLRKQDLVSVYGFVKAIVAGEETEVRTQILTMIGGETLLTTLYAYVAPYNANVDAFLENLVNTVTSSDDYAVLDPNLERRLPYYTIAYVLELPLEAIVIEPMLAVEYFVFYKIGYLVLDVFCVAGYTVGEGEHLVSSVVEKLFNNTKEASIGVFFAEAEGASKAEILARIILKNITIYDFIFDIVMLPHLDRQWNAESEELAKYKNFIENTKIINYVTGIEILGLVVGDVKLEDLYKGIYIYWLTTDLASNILTLCGKDRAAEIVGAFKPLIDTGKLYNLINAVNYEEAVLVIFADATIGELYEIVKGLNFKDFDLTEYEKQIALFENRFIARLILNFTPDELFGNIVVGDLVGEQLGWLKSDGKWVMTSDDEMANTKVADLVNKWFGFLPEKLRNFAVILCGGITVVLLGYIQDKTLDALIGDKLADSVKETEFYQVVAFLSIKKLLEDSDKTISSVKNLTFGDMYRFVAAVINEYLVDIDCVLDTQIFEKLEINLDKISLEYVIDGNELTLEMFFGGLTVGDFVRSVLVLLGAKFDYDMFPETGNVYDKLLESLDEIEFLKITEYTVDDYLGDITYGDLLRMLVENVRLLLTAPAKEENETDGLIALPESVTTLLDVIAGNLDKIPVTQPKALSVETVLYGVSWGMLVDVVLELTESSVEDLPEHTKKIVEAILNNIDELYITETDEETLNKTFEGITYGDVARAVLEITKGDEFIAECDEEIRDLVEQFLTNLDGIAVTDVKSIVNPYKLLDEITYGMVAAAIIALLDLDRDAIPLNTGNLIDKILNNIDSIEIMEYEALTFEVVLYGIAVGEVLNAFYDLTGSPDSMVLNNSLYIRVENINLYSLIVNTKTELRKFADVTVEEVVELIAAFFECIIDPDVKELQLYGKVMTIKVYDIVKNNEELYKALDVIDVNDVAEVILFVANYELRTEAAKIIYENLDSLTVAYFRSEECNVNITLIKIFDNVTYGHVYDAIVKLSGWKGEIRRAIEELDIYTYARDFIIIRSYYDGIESDFVKGIYLNWITADVASMILTLCGNEKAADMVEIFDDLTADAKIYNLLKSKDVTSAIKELFGTSTLGTVADCLSSAEIYKVEEQSFADKFDLVRNVNLGELITDFIPEVLFGDTIVGDFVGEELGWIKDIEDGKWKGTTDDEFANAKVADIVNKWFEFLPKKIRNFAVLALGGASVILYSYVQDKTVDELVGDKIPERIKENAIYKALAFVSMKKLVEDASSVRADLYAITYGDVYDLVVSLVSLVWSDVDKYVDVEVLNTISDNLHEIKLLREGSIGVVETSATTSSVFNVPTAEEVLKGATYADVVDALFFWIGINAEEFAAPVEAVYDKLMANLCVIELTNVDAITSFQIVAADINARETLELAAYVVGKMMGRTVIDLTIYFVDDVQEVVNKVLNNLESVLIAQIDKLTVWTVIDGITVSDVATCVSHTTEIVAKVCYVIKKLVGDAVIADLILTTSYTDFIQTLFGDTTVGDVYDVLASGGYNVKADATIGYYAGLFDEVLVASVLSNPAPEKIFLDITWKDVLGPVCGWTTDENGEYLYPIGLRSEIQTILDTKVSDTLYSIFVGVHPYLITAIVADVVVHIVLITYAVYSNGGEIRNFLDRSITDILESTGLDQYLGNLAPVVKDVIGDANVLTLILSDSYQSFVEELFGDSTVGDVLDHFVFGNTNVEYTASLFANRKFAEIFTNPTPSVIFSNVTIGQLVGPYLGWTATNSDKTVWEGTGILSEYANWTAVALISSIEGFNTLTPYMQTLCIATVAGIGVGVYALVVHYAPQINEIIYQNTVAENLAKLGFDELAIEANRGTLAGELLYFINKHFGSMTIGEIVGYAQNNAIALLIGNTTVGELLDIVDVTGIITSLRSDRVVNIIITNVYEVYVVDLITVTSVNDILKLVLGDMTLVDLLGAEETEDGYTFDTTTLPKSLFKYTDAEGAEHLYTVAELIGYVIDNTLEQNYLDRIVINDIWGIIDSEGDMLDGLLGTIVNNFLDAHGNKTLSEIKALFESGDVTDILLGDLKIGDILDTMDEETLNKFGFIGDMLENNRDRTISGLLKEEDIMATLVGDMQLGDIMGYDVDEDGNWISGGKELDALNSAIADIKLIDVLSNNFDAKKAIGHLMLGEVMGYYYDATDKKWYTDEAHNNEVDKLIGAIASITLDTLMGEGDAAEAIKDALGGLYLGEIMGYERDENGNWLSGGEELDALNSAIANIQLSVVFKGFDAKDALGGLMLGEVMSYYYTKDETTGKYTWYKDKDCTPGNEVDKLVGSVCDILLEDLMSGKADEKIKEALGKLYLGEVMGYYYSEAKGKWYTDEACSDGKEVDVLIGTIANLTLDTLMGNDPAKAITDALGTLYLGEVMGYTLTDGKWLDKNKKEVDVLISRIANLKLEALMGDDPATAIKNALGTLYLGEIMGYERDEDGNWLSEGEKLSALNGAIANIQLKAVFEGFDAKDVLGDLYLGEIMNYHEDGGKWKDENNKEVDKLVGAVCGIQLKALMGSDAASEIKNALGKLYLGEVMGYYYKETETDTDGKPTQWYTDEACSVGKEVDVLIGKIASLKLADIMGNDPAKAIKDALGDLYLGEIMGYTKETDGWYKADGTKLDAINNAIANISLGAILNNTFNAKDALGDLYLGEIMNYYYSETKGKWYTDEACSDDNEVDKIVGSICGIKLETLMDGSKATTEIKNAIGTLYLGDMVDSAIRNTNGVWYQNEEQEDGSTELVQVGVMYQKLYSLKLSTVMTDGLDLATVFEGVMLGEIMGKEKILDADNQWKEGAWKDSSGNLSYLENSIMCLEFSDLITGKASFSKIFDTELGYVMGYTCTTVKEEGKEDYNEWRDAEGVLATGVKAAFMDVNLNDLINNQVDFMEIINGLKIEDIFGTKENRKSILKLIDDGTTIANIGDACKEAMEKASVAQLQDAGILTLTDEQLTILATKLASGDLNTIKGYTLTELMAAMIVYIGLH